MKVKNHRLFNDDDTAVPFKQSPNLGGPVQRKYLIMHFTAGSSAQESIDWLTNKNAKASAHVVIGRDGSITQLVPFDRIAWHAGVSNWGGLSGLNSCSLGIELDNAGRLTRHGNCWRAWFGVDYQENEVVQAVHKHETEMCGWLDYPAVQIESALRVAEVLVAKYGLTDVLGHEDIAPHRKCDPGPAFPMANFRAKLLGRAADAPALYATTTTLNVRTGPGAHFPLVGDSPLPAGTQVQVVKSQGTWWQVDMPADISGPLSDMEGWVNSRFLQQV